MPRRITRRPLTNPACASPVDRAELQRLGHDDAQEQPNPEFWRLRADTGSSGWTWERCDESTTCGAAGPVDARPAGRGRLRRRGRDAAGRRAAGGDGLPGGAARGVGGRPERDAEPERADRDAEARVPARAGRPGSQGARAAVAALPAGLASRAHHRQVRRGDPRGGQRLPGQAPPQGDRRRRRAHLAATGPDDQDPDARPALQRPAPRAGHPRGRQQRRAGARPPGPPGLDRLAVRRRDRHVRRRDGRGGPRLPGEARHPGHRQGGPAHAGPVARHDLPAVVRADAQHHARSPARSTRGAGPAARCAWTSPRTRCAG